MKIMQVQEQNLSRTSHEVRGLKCEVTSIIEKLNMSHLTRGAWIEIYMDQLDVAVWAVAPHTRCVD